MALVLILPVIVGGVSLWDGNIPGRTVIITLCHSSELFPEDSNSNALLVRELGRLNFVSQVIFEEDLQTLTLKVHPRSTLVLKDLSKRMEIKGFRLDEDVVLHDQHCALGKVRCKISGEM